ncbi:MAG: vitamin B12 dependent methionine synthase, activation domain protein [Oscillospiraceae bacterium]|nr:vitamin B12 dependent methionine synthase, activation domain protein [Oscillospiraceae bacterium]
MERRLTAIDRAEALGYLGCPGGDAPEELRAQVEAACDLLFRTARPRALVRIFERNDRALPGTAFRLEGEDIMAHLSGCHRVVVMAATLGRETEELLLRFQVKDLAMAVVLDACASAAIESVCNDLEEELRLGLAEEGLCLTGRYSPGYGDFPLSAQSMLCDLLDSQRRMGLTLTPSGLMLPRKSVTALLGVSHTLSSRTRRGCTGCPGYDTCIIRKGGRSCVY